MALGVACTHASKQAWQREMRAVRGRSQDLGTALLAVQMQRPNGSISDCCLITLSGKSPAASCSMCFAEGCCLCKHCSTVINCQKICIALEVLNAVLTSANSSKPQARSEAENAAGKLSFRQSAVTGRTLSFSILLCLPHGTAGW